MEEKLESVFSKIDNAHEEFRQKMLSLENENLYEYAYRIFVVEELYDILRNGCEFTEKTLNNILKFNGNILLQIYSEWLGVDYSHRDAFENVIQDTLNQLP